MRLPAIILSATNLLTGATAQQPTITVQNLSPFRRREWARVVVPFAKSAVPAHPELRVGSGPTIWQPIGARWPDGSLRQALCFFPVEMDRLSEVSLQIEEGPPQPVPAEPKIIDPLRIGTVAMSIEVTVGGKVLTSTPEYVRDLESNPARKVSFYRCRLGKTGLLFELILQSYAGQAHCYVSLAVFFSDPSSKHLQLSIDRLGVKSKGMRLTVRHANRFRIDNRQVDGGSAVTLLGKVVLGDGQGIRRVGVLTPILPSDQHLRDQTLQAATLGPVLAATTWTNSKAYGPFGYVPEPPPWMAGNSVRSAMAKRHAKFVQGMAQRGDPFARLPWQLMKNPGATGNQSDFGILKLAPVASTGLPSFLLEVEPSVLQEACRPVHFFESDGSMFKIANHPDVVFWDGRPHWNCGVSTDRLGKPCPVPKFFTNRWRGKDRQHWSSNYLCGYYLMTGSHWARREIENEVQLFLASQTVKAGIATTGSGAARAVGRMLMLGCWLHLCTGDKELLDRMHRRMQVSYLTCWAGRDFTAGSVRPMAIKNPSGKILAGATRYWSPWQESLAAIGLFAFFRTTGDPIAKRMAETISLTVLRHGWLVDRNRARVGYAIKWNDDHSPITDREKIAAEPTVCKWAGGGITAWSVGAIEVARYFALARNDKDTLAKAERILQLVRQQHTRPPSDGWWGDKREWDAVR